MNFDIAVSGPRDLWVPTAEVEAAIRQVFAAGRSPVRTGNIIVGGASGVDACVAEYAMEVLGIIPRVYPAWWSFYPGGTAGPIRNLEMIRDAGRCLVIRDKSRKTAGTSNFLEMAKAEGKFCFDYNPNTYRVMDEQERRAHKAGVLKEYKERRLYELRKVGE